MAGFTVNITGLKELDRRLQEMGTQDAKRCIRKALNAGGTVMQEAIQAITPVRPDLPSGSALPVGAMVNDILISNYTADNNLAVLVGPGHRTAHAARWTEYGHEMVTRGGKGAGQVPPHSFIRRGYESAREPAVEAIVTTLASEIEKAAPGRQVA